MARSAEGLAPQKWRGRWRAAVTVGYNERGRQKRKWCYAKTREECLKKWNEMKKKHHEGTLPTGTSMSVKQWFEHWFRVKEKDVTKRTLEEYSYTLRHVLPHLGRIKVDKLTPLHVQRMQLAVAEKVSARAAVHARKLVHNALDDALKLGVVGRNVAAAVDPVKYETEELLIWSASEVLRFLEVAEVAPYYPIFYTALTTGMRPGELIALHWEDIEGDKLHVKYTVSFAGGKPILKAPKTKHGKRVIPLPADTVNILRQHREAQGLHNLDSHLTFPARTGNFLQHRNLLRALRLYSDKADVPKIRMHDLRHTYASMRIANGADVVRLSRDLGHANASFTLNVYAHLFARYQEREAPSLNELVGLHENLKKAA